MSKPMTLPRLACLTAALAAGSALTTAEIANARVNHQRATSHIQQRHSHPANHVKRNGISPRFVISGQSANVKRVVNKDSHQARYQPTQTATKGNPTQRATAGNAAPNAKPPNGTVYATDKRVVKVLAAAAAVTVVPAAAAVGAGIVGHPAMGIIGILKHGNPITGPAQETVDFVKDYATGVANTVESWF